MFLSSPFPCATDIIEMVLFCHVYHDTVATLPQIVIFCHVWHDKSKEAATCKIEKVSRHERLIGSSEKVFAKESIV